MPPLKMPPPKMPLLKMPPLKMPQPMMPPADDVPPGREEPEEDGGNAEAPQVFPNNGTRLQADAFSTTDKGKPSVWICHQQYRQTKELQNNKYRYRCCGCSESVVIQMTNDDEGRILMRGPKHFPHRNCSKLSNAAAEEQVRLRRRVQAAASQQGSSSTAVREIIGQHGNDFTTVRDERNLHSAYHRANNRANGIERMRNIATDPAGYYEDFSAAIAHFGSSCTRDDRRFLLYSDHNQPMFIWGADRNIESLAQAQTLIFDGTFYSAPAGFEQLWTAIAVVDGFYVPTFFVLMKNRQQTEYESPSENSR
ncbi:hypothetical protein FOZ60_012248 [Perkinsus olseni]|uniref:Uncharacterized protein n=1 Tax=Perkinsus olseni TaxID=32597 RepID=A0A7J6NCZ1_PEROL|nr:hypothetical protein FOZ60_012248 [Perkinsus olseni]